MILIVVTMQRTLQKEVMKNTINAQTDSLSGINTVKQSDANSKSIVNSTHPVKFKEGNKLRYSELNSSVKLK